MNKTELGQEEEKDGGKNEASINQYPNGNL